MRVSLEFALSFHSSLVTLHPSTDPISFAAGDTNLNRYVGNSPVNATDPSGLFEWKGWLKAGANYARTSVWLMNPYEQAARSYRYIRHPVRKLNREARYVGNALHSYGDLLYRTNPATGPWVTTYRFIRDTKKGVDSGNSLAKATSVSFAKKTIVLDAIPAAIESETGEDLIDGRDLSEEERQQRRDHVVTTVVIAGVGVVALADGAAARGATSPEAELIGEQAVCENGLAGEVRETSRWWVYEQRHGAQQTTMRTQFEGSEITVRLDRHQKDRRSSILRTMIGQNRRTTVSSFRAVSDPNSQVPDYRAKRPLPVFNGTAALGNQSDRRSRRQLQCRPIRFRHSTCWRESRRHSRGSARAWTLLGMSLRDSNHWVARQEREY